MLLYEYNVFREIVCIPISLCGVIGILYYVYVSVATAPGRRVLFLFFL